MRNKSSSFLLCHSKQAAKHRWLEMFLNISAFICLVCHSNFLPFTIFIYKNTYAYTPSVTVCKKWSAVWVWCSTSLPDISSDQQGKRILYVTCSISPESWLTGDTPEEEELKKGSSPRLTDTVKSDRKVSGGAGVILAMSNLTVDKQHCLTFFRCLTDTEAHFKNGLTHGDFT